MSREFVSLGKDQIDHAKRMLVGFEDQIPKAASRAINRALENARSNFVKDVRESYHLKARDVRDTIKITRARHNDLVGEVKSTGSPLPLSSFKVRPSTVNGRRRIPLRVSVRKGQVSELDRAFNARVGGGVKVFERVGKSRLPIKKLYGPSVPQALGNDQIVNEVAKKARETLNDRLDHEINRILDGAR